MPELSVVVIVRDGTAAVRRLVASLGRSRQDTGAPYEVVVVDDGSAVPVASGVDDLSDDVPLLVVRRDGTGNRAAARSAGAARARGRFLAFLDADQEVPAHWVAEHLRWQHAFPAVTSSTGNSSTGSSGPRSAVSPDRPARQALTDRPKTSCSCSTPCWPPRTHW